jgi:protein LSM14
MSTTTASVATPPGGGLQSQQLLGSRLSIITTAQIRYEGILTAVDPVNKSMTLMNVASFGSEGRRQGNNEIVPSESEISEVVFKIEHIKDFKIMEKPNTMLVDPAIISVTEKPPAEMLKIKPKQDDEKDSGFYEQFSS